MLILWAIWTRFEHIQMALTCTQTLYYWKKRFFHPDHISKYHGRDRMYTTRVQHEHTTNAQSINHGLTNSIDAMVRANLAIGIP